MRLTDLLNHVLTMQSRGCGSFIVTIKYRGQAYQCESNNSLAYDRINAALRISNRANYCGYTLRQALRAIYDECKTKNVLI